MDQATIIQRKADILFSKLDEEYLALDATAGFCYGLNLVSGRIWTLLEQPLTLGTLCAQLRSEYAVDEQTCLHDVREVVASLAQAGLVTTQSAG